MDDLRGFDTYGSPFGDGGEYVSYDDELHDEEDIGLDAPPAIAGDERRLQVRAYNFWTALLGDRNFPDIEDLEPADVPDFADNAVLLDFTSGIENPSIQYIGGAIREECGIGGDITYLDEVPPRSLMTRITDHYLQIIANRAPIGFEAEFVNQRGVTIMYRGILLPFSSDDDSIDFIYGVINWKEATSDAVSGELQLEVENALRTVRPRPDPVPVWADAPSHMDDEGSAAAGMVNAAFAVADLGAEASLADWVCAAQTKAQAAERADLRSRSSLYAAIGMAYDVSLIAEQNPGDYAALLKDMDLTAQARAPMTPIVKLVFGVDYDKTRLTEYAAALGYAKRAKLACGELAAVLEGYDGGLKALVRDERAARRADKPVRTKPDPRAKLRAAEPKTLDLFAGSAEEFVLLVARRQGDGSMAIIGNVDGDAALTEKALRKTII